MRKFYRYLAFLSQIFVVLFISGCAAVVVDNEHGEHIKKNYEKYLSINPGDSFEKVQAIFGSSWILQFSVLRNNEIFSLIEYNKLILAEDLDYSQIVWVVLRNDQFFNIMNPIAPNREAPWNIQDEESVNKIIEKAKEPFSKDYWQQRWKNETLEYSNYLKRRKIDPGLTVVALALFPFMIVTMAPTMLYEQHKNDTLFKKYDGSKAHIGMKTEEVDLIFGAPLRSEEIEPSEIARYYGEIEGLGIQELGNIPFVAIVFKDGLASRIFSGSFFDKNWVLARSTK